MKSGGAARTSAQARKDTRRRADIEENREERRLDTKQRIPDRSKLHGAKDGCLVEILADILVEDLIEDHESDTDQEHAPAHSPKPLPGHPASQAGYATSEDDDATDVEDATTNLKEDGADTKLRAINVVLKCRRRGVSEKRTRRREKKGRRQRETGDEERREQEGPEGSDQRRHIWNISGGCVAPPYGVPDLLTKEIPRVGRERRPEGPELGIEAEVEDTFLKNGLGLHKRRGGTGSTGEKSGSHPAEMSKTDGEWEDRAAVHRDAVAGMRGKERVGNTRRHGAAIGEKAPAVGHRGLGAEPEEVTGAGAPDKLGKEVTAIRGPLVEQGDPGMAVGRKREPGGLEVGTERRGNREMEGSGVCAESGVQEPSLLKWSGTRRRETDRGGIARGAGGGPDAVLGAGAKTLGKSSAQIGNTLDGGPAEVEKKAGGKERRRSDQQIVARDPEAAAEGKQDSRIEERLCLIGGLEETDERALRRPCGVKSLKVGLLNTGEGVGTCRDPLGGSQEGGSGAKAPGGVPVASRISRSASGPPLVTV